MKTDSPTVICLTPVRNEAWVIEQFLACASLWADKIILADQRSTDSTRVLAAKFAKVTILDNDCSSYNEGYHHKLLLDAARRLPSPRLLIAIDADEFLTPNFGSSDEWRRMLQVPPGTVINFEWANLRPDGSKYWSPAEMMSFGFMDDGTEYEGVTVHSGRIPVPRNAPTFPLHDVKVMHYQYRDWARMESKQRWYQCMERLISPEKSAVNLYRQYHHMDAVRPSDLRDVPSWWYDGYARGGIDLRTVRKEKTYWWDREVLGLFQQHGTRSFSQLPIWDVDWKTVAERHGLANTIATKDPRNLLERFFHRYASLTQSFQHSWLVRRSDKVFRRLLRLQNSRRGLKV